MRDYSDYVGINFKKGGRTKEDIDCYGLLMLLFKDFHGIELPDYRSPALPSDIQSLINTEKTKWEPCELQEGAVIIFNIIGYGSHVGYYIGDDLFIHASEGVGSVVIERLSFSWKNRIMGIYKWPK